MCAGGVRKESFTHTHQLDSLHRHLQGRHELGSIKTDAKEGSHRRWYTATARFTVVSAGEEMGMTSMRHDNPPPPLATFGRGLGQVAAR